MALSWSCDKSGPMCRSVEDCALVLDAINGPDDQDLAVQDIPFNWDAQSRHHQTARRLFESRVRKHAPIPASKRQRCRCVTKNPQPGRKSNRGSVTRTLRAKFQHHHVRRIQRRAARSLRNEPRRTSPPGRSNRPKYVSPAPINGIPKRQPRPHAANARNGAGNGGYRRLHSPLRLRRLHPKSSSVAEFVSNKSNRTSRA